MLAMWIVKICSTQTLLAFACLFSAIKQQQLPPKRINGFENAEVRSNMKSKNFLLVAHTVGHRDGADLHNGVKVLLNPIDGNFLNLLDMIRGRNLRIFKSSCTSIVN